MKYIQLFETWVKKYGERLSIEKFSEIENGSKVIYRGTPYTVQDNTGATLVLKPEKNGSPISVNLNMFNEFGAITEAYKYVPGNVKIAGKYEITIDSKVVNTKVAGFERENDDSDSLYFMDEDPLRDTLGSLTVKNADMFKLEKGTVVKAIGSKNKKEVKIKRVGDL